MENPFLPFAPVDFHRKPEPVPRTQVLSYVRAGARRARSALQRCTVNPRTTNLKLRGLESSKFLS